MELAVFVLAGAACLVGAGGVVISRNPVHAALSLVGTLFGIAVLFVAQEAHFLAAVQVIVYAGAIVVLLLFVLMLLGVDRAEDLSVEPIAGQRAAAAVVGLAILALPIAALASTGWDATGAPAAEGAPNQITDDRPDVDQIGESLFTTHLFALEVTSLLLVVAVVGAVVMARRARAGDEVDDPLVAAAEQARAERSATAAGDEVDVAEGAGGAEHVGSDS